jgi:hypothetical protein
MRSWQTLLRPLLGAIILYGVCIFFTAFLYSQNSSHAFIDGLTTEIELFKGSQELSHLPSIFNSDLVMPFLVVQDLLEPHSSINDWVLSPALYVFPDWFIAGALVLLKIPNQLLPLFYSGFQYAALSLAIGSLVNQLTRIGLWTGAALACLVLLACGTLAIAMPGSMLSYYLFLWIGAAYIHSGALLMTVIASYLIFTLLNTNKNSFVALGLLGLVVFLSTFSDFIFVVWFVVPVTVFCCLVGTLRNHAYRWGIIFSVLLPALAAVFIEGVLRNQTLHSRAHHTGSISQWLTDVGYFWATADYVMILLILVNVALIARAGFVFLLMMRSKPVTQFNLIELLLGLICLVALVTPLVMNVYRGLALWRYFLVLAILPTIWLSCGLGLFVERMQWKRVIALVAGAALVILGFAAFTPSKNAVHSLLAISPLEACLNAHGLSTGYGDYWNAKAHIFTSEGRIHIMQLNEYKPYPFAFNARWFAERANRDKPLDPNFVIMENLNEADVLRVFGKPDNITMCNNKTIWQYQKTLTAPPY